MKKLRMILFTILLLIVGGYTNVQANGISSLAASVSMSSAFLANNQCEQSSLGNSEDVIDIDKLLNSQTKKFQAGQQLTVLLPDGTYSGESKTVNITVKGKRMADMKLSDGSEYAEVTFLAQMTGGDVVQFIANFECDNFLLIPSDTQPCTQKSVCHVISVKKSLSSYNFQSSCKLSSLIRPVSKPLRSSSVEASSKLIHGPSSTCVSESLERSSSKISTRISSSSHECVRKQPLYFSSRHSFKHPLHSSSKLVVYTKSSKKISGGSHSIQKLRSSSHCEFYSRSRRSLLVNSSSSVPFHRFQNQGTVLVSSSNVLDSRSLWHSKGIYNDANYEAHTVSPISNQNLQILSMTSPRVFSKPRWHSIDLKFSLNRLPLSDVHNNHMESKIVVVHHHRHKHTHTHRIAIRGRLPETRMDPYTGLYSLIGLIIVIISGRALLSKKSEDD